QLRDALVRIAGIENPAMEEILPSAQVYQYRNRLDFAFSEKEWLTADKLQNKEYQIQPALGFHITGRFDKVLNIDECLLMQEPTNRIRNFVKSFALKENYTFFNRISQQGDLRNMLVRNTTSGQWMVVIMFADADEEKRSRMLNAIKEEFPEITSLYYFINQKKNDTFFDLQPVLWSGTETITESMGGLKFTIGPKTFFQTNPVQANELYKTALSFAALQPQESVYDLYTGTGTIANFLAKQCKRVIGIDNVEDSIVQARLNSESNAIYNTVFFAGDMRETLDASFFEANGFPDVIITDPPRAGMHPDVVNRICNSGAGRIVYVSCNPSTMARDIALMKDHYTLVKVKPVDMFPQTDHIECVALLEKK
ncbi:MAG TPA: 23S rRNA (uracil(1939)-C(5))-methyltransferase RlmD, partial [Bacteroidia bacterium]|nr:23S rRNA (uracil(1939)-C(5))-methyltransferase RlmD [Bacteroidia bacterium]